MTTTVNLIRRAGSQGFYIIYSAASYHSTPAGSEHTPPIGASLSTTWTLARTPRSLKATYTPARTVFSSRPAASTTISQTSASKSASTPPDGGGAISPSPSPNEFHRQFWSTKPCSPIFRPRLSARVSPRKSPALQPGSIFVRRAQNASRPLRKSPPAPVTSWPVWYAATPTVYMPTRSAAPANVLKRRARSDLRLRSERHRDRRLDGRGQPARHQSSREQDFRRVVHNLRFSFLLAEAYWDVAN